MNNNTSNTNSTRAPRAAAPGGEQVQGPMWSYSAAAPRLRGWGAGVGESRVWLLPYTFTPMPFSCPVRHWKEGYGWATPIAPARTSRGNVNRIAGWQRRASSAAADARKAARLAEREAARAARARLESIGEWYVPMEEETSEFSMQLNAAWMRLFED